MHYEKHLLRDKRFWPTFWTQFWGGFNDNVFKNAMVIMITYKSFSLLGLGAEQMVALCGGVFILPFFLFSAFAGQVADKLPKHKLMVWIKFWEIAVMIVGAAGFITENISVLLFTLFMMGLQSTFFGPVKYSVLPELINEEELVQGNSLIEMGTFVSILLGTILGGLLIGLPVVGKYYVSGAVILFSIIGTFFSTKVQELPATDPKLKVKIGIIRPTLEILKLSKEVKGVWNSILGISWFWFFGAALLSVLPVFVKDIIGGNQQVVTLFLALFSIGVAIGSILCEKFSHERLELGLVPFGSIGMTIFMIDLFFVDKAVFNSASSTLIGVSEFLSFSQSWRIIADLALLSIFSGFFIVPLYTYIQQMSRPEVRSRIIAGNNILNALFMVLASLLLTGLYALGWSSTDMFLAFGVLNAVVAMYIYTVIPEFLLRFMCMVLTRSIYRLKVSGLNNIPDEGAAVLVCNHVSFVDWLIIAAGVKRPIRFVMHHSFMKIAFLKFFFRGAKVIPIAGFKECQTTLNKAFDSISEELEAGELICIFPEGQITKDGELNTYKTGIEKILSRNPVAVIPMTLKGLWGSYFSRKYGKAASKPLVIGKTILSRIQLDIGPAWKPESVSASALEKKTIEMLSGSK